MNGRKRRKLNNLPSFWVKATYFDYPALFLILFLVLFGLIIVYSTSYYTGIIDADDPGYFFKRQLFFAILGFGVFFVVANYSYQRVFRFSKILMYVEFVLLFAVYLFPSVNGSHRWINLGFASFQPSEIAKLVLAIYVAHICTAYEQDLYSFKKTFLHLMLPLAMVCVIAVENLSTAIICGVIVFAIYFISTPRPIYILAYVILGILGVIGFIVKESYRGDRIDAWLKPETSEYGYQTRQALYAIGSGGLFGRGLGNSLQKVGYIPEAHNDMVFSVICEELGIVGAAGLIIVVVILLWRLRFIAEGAPDRLGSLLVVGVMAHLGMQYIVNICVVTNLFPNTGVTLPFISYGGTSLLILLAEMGFVLSVSRQIVPKGYVERKGVTG